MQNVDVIRHELLELHRLLLDEERRDYERVHGKKTPSELLQLLVNDAAFAWLQPFTSLIVALDDQEAGDFVAWMDRARELLRPDAAGGAFQQRYDTLVQKSPELAVAHGSAMRVLRR